MHDGITYQEWKKARWGIDWSVIINHLRHTGKPVNQAVEVGIGPLDISALPYFVQSKVPTIRAIEANNEMYLNAKNAYPEITIINRAVWHTSNQKIMLNINGGSSAVEGQWCPTRGHKHQQQVRTINIADIDDGEIDVLNIDCEGCEHYVLQSLKSRPHVIGIELWSAYPEYAYCENWLIDNGYKPIFETGPTSETKIFQRAN